MTLALPARALALSAAVATLAVTLVALPTSPLAPATSAAADSASCTGYGDYPNVLSGGVYAPTFVYRQDGAVNAYIAGDWTVIPGAAEAEGVIVVGDDATFSTGEGFFLGKVGVGSQVSALAGSDMLTVGGDVAVTGAGSLLDIGPVIGGNLRVGGTITPALPSSSYTFNGGGGFAGTVAPLLPFAATPTYYTALSAEFDGLATTGSTVDLSNSSEVHFIGDNTQSRQVFTVSGSDLGTTVGGKDIHFDNMATDAVVVINVTGTVAEMNTWRFYVDGVELEHGNAGDRIFSNWAQSITWNFVDATDVTLGVNAQIPGAILIPSAGANLDLQSSVNGRLFVNGDVTFGGNGSSGIEFHSYGMRTCSLAPADGTFTIAKTVSDPATVTDPDREYSGTYECLDGLGNAVDDGTWTLEGGETATVTGLPAGTVCSATEDASTLTADPSSSDPTYTWGAPTYSDDAVTIVAGDDVQITVTNVVLHDVGSLSITKALSDPDAVVPDSRAFTGTYSCTDSVPTVVASGTWSLVAGASTTITGIPSGAECAVLENASTLVTPPSADATYSWSAVSYSSASVLISTGTTSSVTVTNALDRAWGQFEVTKSLDDPDAVVATGRIFTGTWRCVDDADAPVANGTWSAQAGGVAYTVDFLPVGTICEADEDALVTPPSATDDSYVWATPTYSDTDVSIIEGDAIGIEVRNAVRRGLGDFEMVKVLDDPYDVVDLSRVYTGTWDCTVGGSSIESGTWSTVAGAAPLSLATDLPAGTVCTLAEDDATLAAPPLAGFPQYVWLAPVITPASVTILDDGLHRITVTNIVYDPIGDIDDIGGDGISGLAQAGTDSMRWLLLGGAVMAGGILLVYFARRRRIA